MSLRRNLLAFSILSIFTPVLLPSAMAAPGDPVCPELEDLSVTAPGDLYLEGTFEGLDGYLFSAKSEFRATGELDIDPLVRLSEALAGKGTKLVYLVLPDRALVYPQALSAETMARFNFDTGVAEATYFQLLASLEAKGIIAPDMLTPLRAAALEHQVYFKRDTHWTSYGAQAAGVALAAALRSDAAFPNSGLAFQTTELPTEEQAGSYATIVQELCGKSYDAEEVVLYQTEPVVAADLLGSAAPAQLAVAGTSFSYSQGGDHFNFVGALSEASGEDVVNFAVSGGGNFSSMTNFLGSDFFRQTPPSYLVWEQGRGIKLVSNQISRQMIATASGPCEGPSVTLPAKQGASAAIGSSAALVGPDNYLMLSYDDVEVGRHTVELGYGDGGTESLILDKGARADLNGRYFVEVSRSNKSGLTGITIEKLSRPAKGNLAVTICSTP